MIKKIINKIKSQAALEFLTTYGWVFIVILIMIAALSYFGILKPSKFLPDRCNFGAEIECMDYTIADNGLNLRLKNNVGETIVVNALSVSTEKTELSCISSIIGDVWAPGDVEDVPIVCGFEGTGIVESEKEKLNLKLTYYKARSGSSFLSDVQGEVFAVVSSGAVEGSESIALGTSCKDILDNGFSSGDGVYTIDPDGEGGEYPFEVYCDMTTDGGGWTRIEFASDLPHLNRWTTGDGWRWIPSNFQKALSTAQIQAIQAVSTEGKQRYDGTCQGVLHGYYTGGATYAYSFGFRFLNGDETNYGVQDLGVDFTIVEDGCKANDGTFRHTIWDIRDVRVPIINVYSRDNGNSGEQFGSPLTQNPAWLR